MECTYNCAWICIFLLLFFKKKGIRIVVVAIGNLANVLEYRNVLRSIAGDNIFYVADYETLQSVTDDIQTLICREYAFTESFKSMRRKVRESIPNSNVHVLFDPKTGSRYSQSFCHQYKCLKLLNKWPPDGRHLGTNRRYLIRYCFLIPEDKKRERVLRYLAFTRTWALIAYGFQGSCFFFCLRIDFIPFFQFLYMV